MTGPEHYQAAEQAIATALGPNIDPERAAIHAQLADAHAALASAAATALTAAATVYARGGAWGYCDEDVTAWAKTVGASQVHAHAG